MAIRVRSDGSGVETANVKMATNPFCENALEQALRWKDSGVANEVQVLTIGPQEATENLRAALALGADSAIHILHDRFLSPLQVAKSVEVIARREDYDVIWLGKQSIDGDNNQTGQMLAALLDWPQALFLSEADVDGDTISVHSEVDDGIALFNIKSPCVLTADLRLNEPRYPALPAILKAKSKPIETISIEELGVDFKGEVETVSVSPPPARQRGRMVADAKELAGFLKSEVKALG